MLFARIVRTRAGLKHPVLNTPVYQEKAHIINDVGFRNSPGRTRTADLVVNSHPLYRLSYWGSTTRFKEPSNNRGFIHIYRRAVKMLFRSVNTPVTATG